MVPPHNNLLQKTKDENRRRRIILFEREKGKYMPTPKIPVDWGKWCTTGRHGGGARKKNAVQKCLSCGTVRGYFSDIPLNPNLEPTHSMYPSFEHLISPENHAEAAVEARIFNDMKSHLSEKEFWQVIEHLFIVGVHKGKIIPPFGKRLPKGWSPEKHYLKKISKSQYSLRLVNETAHPCAKEKGAQEIFDS
jgi:hypothetical protein